MPQYGSSFIRDGSLRLRHCHAQFLFYRLFYPPSLDHVRHQPQPKPCKGLSTHSSSSGTSSPHHRNQLHYRRNLTRSSTILPCTSCSQSVRTSRPRPNPRHVQQSAPTAPFRYRTFRSPPGSRHHSRAPGPGYRSWVRNGPLSSSSGKSSRLLRRRGR